MRLYQLAVATIIYYHILLKLFVLVPQAGGFFQAYCQIHWTNESMHHMQPCTPPVLYNNFLLADYHLPSQREL